MKPESGITVAFVLLTSSPGPAILPELLDIQQHLHKVLTGQAPEVWKPELWLTFQAGARSAPPLKQSWLESVKLLPRVGKTDGQTKQFTFADVVFHHLAREELAAV